MKMYYVTRMIQIPVAVMIDNEQEMEKEAENESGKTDKGTDSGTDTESVATTFSGERGSTERRDEAIVEISTTTIERVTTTKGE